MVIELTESQFWEVKVAFRTKISALCAQASTLAAEDDFIWEGVDAVVSRVREALDLYWTLIEIENNASLPQGKKR